MDTMYISIPVKETLVHEISITFVLNKILGTLKTTLGEIGLVSTTTGFLLRNNSKMHPFIWSNLKGESR